MTDKQKQALLLAGGVAVVVFAVWSAKRGPGFVPTATAVSPAPAVTGGDAPQAYVYNVQPIDNPAPGVISITNNPIQGCGCGGAGGAQTDGCFTANPLANGSGPLSLSQLLASYTAAGSNIAQSVIDSQMNYAYTLPTISQAASAKPDCSFYTPTLAYLQRAAGRCTDYGSSIGPNPFIDNPYYPDTWT